MPHLKLSYLPQTCYPQPRPKGIRTSAHLVCEATTYLHGYSANMGLPSKVPLRSLFLAKLTQSPPLECGTAPQTPAHPTKKPQTNRP